MVKPFYLAVILLLIASNPVNLWGSAKPESAFPSKHPAEDTDDDFSFDEVHPRKLHKAEPEEEDPFKDFEDDGAHTTPAPIRAFDIDSILNSLAAFYKSASVPSASCVTGGKSKGKAPKIMSPLDAARGVGMVVIGTVGFSDPADSPLKLKDLSKIEDIIRHTVRVVEKNTKDKKNGKDLAYSAALYSINAAKGILFGAYEDGFRKGIQLSISLINKAAEELKEKSLSKDAHTFKEYTDIISRSMSAVATGIDVVQPKSLSH